MFTFIIILFIIYNIIINIYNQTGVLFYQGVQFNNDPINESNDSILLYSIEKLKKDELVKTVKELQSKVKEDNKNYLNKCIFIYFIYIWIILFWCLWI